MAVGRNQFLAGCAEGLSSLLAAGLKPLHSLVTWPLCRVAHGMAADFQSRRSGLWSLCSLISEVTSHDFCHTLFVTRKSVGSGHTQGEGASQGCDAPRGGITGVIQDLPAEVCSVKEKQAYGPQNLRGGGGGTGSRRLRRGPVCRFHEQQE